MPSEGLSLAGSISTAKQQEEWILSQTGNWSTHKLDLDGDANFNETFGSDSELYDLGTFNVANELTGRDIDNDSTDEYTLTYDAVGNLTDDGENYEYVYDAFGRLNQVKDESTGNVISQYRYYGNGHRASSVNDSDSDDDLADETVTYLYHNEQWQLTNTFHGSDADPYERYIHHAAGLYGGGSSSYIDRVILIDRDTNLDGTFETRLYPMQNFRADVIGMITDTGKQRGQTRYDPYGVPMGIFAGDVNGDGIWDGGDLSILASELTASNYHVRYDENLDGTFEAADISAFINLGHVGGRGVPSDLNSPFSYAGYEDDPDLAGSKMHVRNRVYLSDIGRWSRRDPAGYIDGLNLNSYTSDDPVGMTDIYGLYSIALPKPSFKQPDGDDEGPPSSRFCITFPTCTTDYVYSHGYYTNCPGSIPTSAELVAAEIDMKSDALVDTIKECLRRTKDCGKCSAPSYQICDDLDEFGKPNCKQVDGPIVLAKKYYTGKGPTGKCTLRFELEYHKDIAVCVGVCRNCPIV